MELPPPFVTSTFREAFLKYRDFAIECNQFQFGSLEEIQANQKKMEPLFAKTFPGLDATRLHHATADVASFIQCHLWKTTGASDVQADAWPQIRQFYGNYIVAGASIAYDVLGQSRFRYEIDRPDVMERVHKVVITAGAEILPHTAFAAQFFQEVDEVGGEMFQQVVPQLLEQGLGKVARPGVPNPIIVTLAFRLLLHGYLGAFFAAGLSENEARKGGGTPASLPSEDHSEPSEPSGQTRAEKGGCASAVLAMAVVGTGGLGLLAAMFWIALHA